MMMFECRMSNTMTVTDLTMSPVSSAAWPGTPASDTSVDSSHRWETERPGSTAGAQCPAVSKTKNPASGHHKLIRHARQVVVSSILIPGIITASRAGRVRFPPFSADRAPHWTSSRGGSSVRSGLMERWMGDSDTRKSSSKSFPTIRSQSSKSPSRAMMLEGSCWLRRSVVDSVSYKHPPFRPTGPAASPVAVA